jgi:hypothetical protein
MGTALRVVLIVIQLLIAKGYTSRYTAEAVLAVL